ncbi:hypothetical protein HDU79_010965 [Rhizoclosmatium sp. JEL0117]|nr:hypothetical protein HDU99_005871 [Rhizoclosmatium hyalinum]KAJ3298379.1 hypothetical protein HDU79_010965 [Rhizoclosmatium sp. JEL0117]
MPPKPAPAKPAAKAAPPPAPASKGNAKDASKKGASGAPATTAASKQPEKSSTSDSSNYLNIDPSLMQRTGLNSVQLQELIEIFSLVDVDHGGTISTDELGVLMNTLGLHPSQMELEAMVKELDSENTGEIDFESFVGAMTKQLETEVTPDELTKAFKMFTLFDTSNELIVPDHEGTMPRSLLVSILTSYGDLDKRMTTAEAEDLISSVAPHGSHTTFDYAQFIQMYLPNSVSNSEG